MATRKSKPTEDMGEITEVVETTERKKMIPKAFDPRVGPAVAKAVAEAARKTGVARI